MEAQAIRKHSEKQESISHTRDSISEEANSKIPDEKKKSRTSCSSPRITETRIKGMRIARNQLKKKHTGDSGGELDGGDQRRGEEGGGCDTAKKSQQNAICIRLKFLF
ncbi:hypothetical protein Rs2_18172 [Raphanus sativus]|nr:hypothetical protein Rs2_18172 [Raphanus sativus]